METDKLMLLAQVIDIMDEQSKALNLAYAKNNKSKFEESRQEILGLQKKVGVLLKQK
jgi:hypothetical protein